MTVKNVKNLEKSRITFEVEVSAEEFEEAVASSYFTMRKKINVPGFRPGKAPRKVIEKLYGPEVFYNDAVDLAFHMAYEDAVDAEELEPIGIPEVEVVGDVTKDGFTFKATVSVYPDVELDGYKGFSMAKEEVVVSDDDVTERLNQMADRNARIVSVEREAKLGDIAVIDFEGFLDGKPFDGGKSTNHELELGSGSFIPGFEDQVVGMKAGEEKDITVTFPEDYYAAELAGKAVVFHVKCDEVKFKELPELDDDFAKDVSEFDTIDELRADVRRQVEEERQKSIDIAYENAVLDKLAGNVIADIPEVMIERQCESMFDEFKSRLAMQGIPYEQYAKMTNMDEAKFMEESREAAIKQVKIDLAMEEIVEEEELEVTDEEIEEEYKKLSEAYGMDVEQVEDYLSERSVRTNLLVRKALAIVMENAAADEMDFVEYAEEDVEENNDGDGAEP